MIGNLGQILRLPMLDFKPVIFAFKETVFITLYSLLGETSMETPVTQRFFIFEVLLDHFEARLLRASIFYHITDTGSTQGHASQI